MAATGSVWRELPDVGFVPTLPRLLARAVELHATNDFIVVADRRLTFAGAEEASARLARRLTELGVGKGCRVAMMYPSSPEFVVAFLAIARIGAIAVMLPSTMKPPELRTALRLSDAALLLLPTAILGKDTGPLVEGALPGVGRQGSGPVYLPEVPYLRHVVLDGFHSASWATPIDGGDRVPEQLLSAMEAEVHPGDELLVIWTSGSTSDPKGIVHTHGAAVRKVAPDVGLGLRPSRPGRIFMTMPLFWVGGPQSLLGCLYSGATLLCQERFDPAAAVDMLRAEEANAIAGWRFMMDRLRAEPSWHTAPIERLEPPRVAPVSRRGDSLNLGMTETFGMHLPGEHFDYRVVDPDTDLDVPDGDEGEFLVRGLSLMSRMYKREREEAFDRDGYFHTGDRGYLEDGRIYFTGRYSETIKSAGANVSPLEVEAVIEGFPEVQTAVVFGAPSVDRGQDVAAVVCVPDGVALTADEVVERCRKELSGYKVPKLVMILSPSEFPMLASGKPDRRAIRELEGGRHARNHR